jgi:hypothetical protein
LKTRDQQQAGIRVVGCDYSAAAARPNATWLASGFLGTNDLADCLVIDRLEQVGSDKMVAHLVTLESEAQTAAESENVASGPVYIGLDFPFSLPLPLAEILLERRPAWLELAQYVGSNSYENFQTVVQSARLKLGGEIKRLPDKLTDPKGQSPMHQINPGMLKMTWQGMAQLLELHQCGFQIEPFFKEVKDAGARVFEVYPAAILKACHLPFRKYKGQNDIALTLRREIVEALTRGDALRSVNWGGQCPARLVLSPETRAMTLASDDALDAVIAALGAALRAKNPAETGPGAHISPELIELEGWIYVPYPNSAPERRL